MNKKQIEKMEAYLNKNIKYLSEGFTISEKRVCLMLQMAFMVNPEKNKEELDYLDYYLKELEEEKPKEEEEIVDEDEIEKQNYFDTQR